MPLQGNWKPITTLVVGRRYKIVSEGIVYYITYEIMYSMDEHWIGSIGSVDSLLKFALPMATGDVIQKQHSRPRHLHPYRMTKPCSFSPSRPGLATSLASVDGKNIHGSRDQNVNKVVKVLSPLETK